MSSLVLAALVASPLTACENGVPDPGARAAAPSPTVTPGSPSSATNQSPQGSRAVHFEASDHVRLAGRLFGRGSTGVVLSHMGNPGDSQTDWWPLAMMLADRGFTVLTYDRRGVCPGGAAGCSSGRNDFGDSWKDVVGAIRFLRALGAKVVVAGGASLGAMATVYAAGRADIDALIVVAPVDIYNGVALTDLVREVSGSKLFLAGRDDDEPAMVVRDMYRRARQPKELVLLNTGEHGTDILTYEVPGAAAKFREAVVGFLTRLASAE